MINLNEKKDKFYLLSRDVLEANDSHSFVDLVCKAYDKLNSAGITDEVIDKVLKEFTPYYRYMDYRSKEELLDKVIKHNCEDI